MLSEQALLIERQGTQFPLFVCGVHDEMYYQPQESHVNNKLANPHVVEVSVAGSVYIGRRPYPRGQMVKGWALMPSKVNE